MEYPTSKPAVAPLYSGASDSLTAKGPAKFPQQYAVLELSVQVEWKEGKSYNTIALAKLRCVYPAILLEIVTRETVNPTDCALTSQKHTSRPQVFERGRYAINAAAMVQRMFAAVAVASRAEEWWLS